ncbi:MAG: hypothetical protein M5U12_30690 [Verrucomicrobia bacterium]|nr:hypothetical protein [Verrucomicrobiota bacterium]
MKQTRLFDILLDGRPSLTVWATDETAALKLARRCAKLPAFHRCRAVARISADDELPSRMEAP